MSTKTIKQRIAVVAVSALTAGILSVMSTPVANASAGAGGISVTLATGVVSTPLVSNGSTTGTGVLTVSGNVTMAITGGSAVFVEVKDS